MVKLDVSKKDWKLIAEIIEKAKVVFGEDSEDDWQGLEMDIAAVHRNGAPLDLQKLLGFDEFNFRHDVAGIQNTIDRSTGKLTKCFLPRCARPEGK